MSGLAPLSGAPGASRRRTAALLGLQALLLALLSACDGQGLLGSRLGGNWCLPGSNTSGEALILTLSGDGTGLMTLIPGTRPSVPFDWREDRERLLLLQPGSQEVAYTVPIVTDAQGQPQLMIPGLGSLLNINLQRCRGGGPAATVPPGTMPPTGWPGAGPAPGNAPIAPAPASPGANEASGAVTLAVVLGGVMLLLLAGAIAVVVILQGRHED